LKGLTGRQSFYLVKVEDSKVAPKSDDVVEVVWVSRKDVEKKLSFENLRRIFKKSLKYIG